MKYKAIIGNNQGWRDRPYYWDIEDINQKISISPFTDYKSKKGALASLKRWIARLHLEEDCEIIDNTEFDC